MMLKAWALLSVILLPGCEDCGTQEPFILFESWLRAALVCCWTQEYVPSLLLRFQQACSYVIPHQSPQGMLLMEQLSENTGFFSSAAENHQEGSSGQRS